MFCAIVLLAGCGSEETVQTQDEIIKPGNTTEMLNADQAESLRKVNKVYVNGLTSITDLQAEFISKIKIEGNLPLNGLTSLTDQQAESLSKVESLSLNGLTSINDQQAESLGKVYFLDVSDSIHLQVYKYRYGRFERNLR